MFIDKLLNQGNAPVLEQQLRFSAKRHRLIAENIVNIDTPRDQQKDLDSTRFQAALRQKVRDRTDAVSAGAGPSAVRFEGLADNAGVDNPRRGILFHDGNNRTVEQLMSDLSSNGLKHNLFVELLKRQFSSIESALKERVS